MKFIGDLLSELTKYYDLLVAIIPKLVFGIVVSAIILFIARNIRKKVINYLKQKADDTLLVNFANSLMKTLIIILISLLFLYIIGLGGIASSVLGAAGLSAFVIGFALKDIGENFLAGVIMAFDRPFKLKDVVKTGNVEGVITNMSLRDTHIKTFDGKDVYVPNGQIIKNPLYNYTIDGYSRNNFSVSISYDSDVTLARSIINDILSETPGILQEAKPHRSHVKQLDASSIEIEVMFWINTYDSRFSSLDLKSDTQTKIVKAFQANDIKIPNDIIELKNG